MADAPFLQPFTVPELLATCKTEEEREAMWDRIDSALEHMAEFAADQRERGNEARTLGVIMARLQRRAGIRPSRPRLVESKDG